MTRSLFLSIVITILLTACANTQGSDGDDEDGVVTTGVVWPSAPNCEEVPGWSMDETYDACVPPADWPPATNCEDPFNRQSGGPPGCVRCPHNPWADEKNCPDVYGEKTYPYALGTTLYCCIHPPS